MQEFPFAKGAEVRQAQAELADAKAKLREVQKDFLAEGPVETLQAKLKEAGGKAGSYVYVTLIEEGEECCGFIKGNAKINNSGNVPINLYYWEYQTNANIAQITGFLTQEQADEWYAKEEAADLAAQEEEAKRKEEEKAKRKAEKEAAKAAKKAEQQAEAGEEASDAEEAAEEAAEDEQEEGAETAEAATETEAKRRGPAPLPPTPTA